MNKHSFKIMVLALIVMTFAWMARADYSNTVMSLNPVAYWPLQETNQPGTNIAVNLGSAGSTYDGSYSFGGDFWGLPGALMGDPTDKSASFQGTGSPGGYLDVPFGSAPSALTINPPFTVEAWLNCESNTTVSPTCALACGNFNSPRSGWLIYNNLGGTWDFRLYNQNGTATSLDLYGGKTDSKWHHVVAVFDGVNASLYVDGQLVAGPTAASGSPNYVADPDSDLTIGARSDGGFVFNGDVDQVAIYTNALSAADILSHYQNGTNTAPSQSYSSLVMADNPLLYYPLNDPMDPVTATNYGSFGAAVNGTYTPDTQPGSPGPVGAGFGATNYACTFTPSTSTGNGGYIDCTTNPILNITNAMTVVAWIKGGPADGRFQSFLGRSDGSWRADMDPTYAHWADGSGNDAVGGTGVNDGNWHFFAGVADGTNNYVYVDGALDGESSMTFNTGDPDHTMIIGGVGDYFGRFFYGSVSQVAIYTNALTAAQIATLYYDGLDLTPVIFKQPQDVAINITSNATFNVEASGEPTSYQWYHGATMLSDGGDVSGSTTPSLSITDAQNSDAGTYTVVVANSFGSVTSAPVTLTVYSSVVLTTDITPTNAILFAGGHVTYSIVAAGASPISYQWYSNDVAIAGATSPSYTLMDAQVPATFHCVASNSYNSQSSSTATLQIITPTASYPTAVIAANPVAFWRLNESGPDGQNGPNNGVTAYDYWGGNNGVYTNVGLGYPGYNPNGEPAETAPIFELLSFSNCMVFDISTNVGFGAPDGSSSSFSVECWVNGYAQTLDAGIVSKGTGGGGEQFNLDTGSDGGTPDHAFRFFVRDASGATHGVSSSIAPDGQWHHLVGVCDEADGYVALYIDGVLVGTNTIPSDAGILPSTASVKIGARPSGANQNLNDDQFGGYIDDVALYNYALSASEVEAQYDSADIPAKVTVQPTNTVANAGGSATFYTRVEGTPPVTNQWYDANTSQPIDGATNLTLTLSNLQSSDNGDSYYLLTANAYGSSQSQPASLTVVSGGLQIQPYGQDVKSPFFAPVGGTGSDSITVYGTEPITYQWQFYSGSAWGDLTDGASVSGSQSNVLTIANAQTSEEGNYRVIASNSFGSITSSVAMFNVGSPIEFYPGFWQANGVATFANNQLTMTTKAGGGTSSYFFKIPQYIGAFNASFTYVNASGDGVVNDSADGFAFVLQNSEAGVNAIGGGGSGLGYANPAITNSAELCFELYDNSDNAPGMAWATGGAPSAGVQTGGFMYNPTDPVSIITNDPIDFTLHYDGNVLAVKMSDEITKDTFSTNIVVGSIPQAVAGDTAYVGFTAACGGVTADQIITNFSFVSINIPVETIGITSTNAVISWSAAISGYTLQENSDLSTTNWMDVTNMVNVVNGQNQVTVPLTPTNEFYRLKLE
jgi:Concanavalin A-like lectin/glucanases superfamily/Immunoglobulin I-set domain/Immunoglobulin domain